MQFHQSGLERNRRKEPNRRVYPQDNSPDSDPAEMMYQDPNANPALSPEIEENQGQYYDQRDPGMPLDSRRINNPNYRPYRGNDQQNPMPMTELPGRDRSGGYERSPKTIGLGSSRDDMYDNYNIRTINARKSPRDSNDDIDQGPYDDYPGYDNSGEYGRIPPQQNQPYQRNRSPVDYNNRSRDLNPYGRRGVPPGDIPINRMSPSQNFDELNSSGEKYPDQINQPQYNNYQNYRGGVVNTQGPRDQFGGVNNTVQNPNQLQLENVRDDVQERYDNRTYNNMSYNDVKRLAKKFNKMYDPNKNSNGLLVEENQVTVPGADDEVFNNRYRVLSKMNRLSNILLAKQRRSPSKYEEDRKSRPRGGDRERDRSYEPDSRRTFNRHTLDNQDRDTNSKKNSRRHLSRSPEHKFLYVSLAMISSKGPTCEDRTILRRMRLEKGGVVDLAQEDPKKNKFTIRKASPRKGGTRGYSFANPKYREKAARVIQQWWRNLKTLYDDRLNKIIKIQSVWRGKFVRKYMYDLFYLNFLYISFCKKIETVLTNHIRPEVWEKLFEGLRKAKKDKEDALRNIVEKDYRNSKYYIEPYWRRWKNFVRQEQKKEDEKSNKSRNLVEKRADKENKLKKVKNSLDKWKYVNKLEQAREEMENYVPEETDELDREAYLNKIRGLFKILDGTEKIVQKDAMEKTKPKLENYLRNKNGQNKLRKIVQKRPAKEKNILRKYLYQWYANTLNEREKSYLEKINEKDIRIDEIRNSVFKNLVDRIQDRINKNLLRKYLHRFFRKSIAVAKEEEKKNYNDLDALHRRRKKEIEDDYEKQLQKLKAQHDKDEQAKKDLQNQIKKERTTIDIKSKKKTVIEQTTSDEDFLNYLKGCEILQRAVWRKTHEDPLNAFGEKLDPENAKYKAYNLYRIRKKEDKELLRKALYKWKNKALNKNYKNGLLSKMFARMLFLTSDSLKRKLLLKKLNQWRRNTGVTPERNEIDTLNAARKLYDLLDVIRKAYVENYGDEFLDKLDKTRNPEIFKKPLKKIVNNRNDDELDKLRKAFYKWRNNVKDERIKDLLNKLLYKNYENNYLDRKKYLLNRAFQKWKNFVNKHNIKVIRRKLEDKGKESDDIRIKILKKLFRSIDDDRNKDLLRKAFNKWKKLSEKEPEPIVDLTELKMMMLKNLVDLKGKDDYIKLLHYFLKWRNNAQLLTNKALHKPLRKKVMKVLLTKNDKELLHKYFNRWRYGGLRRIPILLYVVAKRFLKKALTRRAFKEFVKKMRERDPKNLRRKGQKLIDVLKKIAIYNPYKEFIEKLKKYGKYRKIKKLKPKIDDSLNKLILRKYFERWANNVKKEEEKERIRHLKLMEDENYRRQRKKQLLLLLIEKLGGRENLDLNNAFMKWRKNARLDEQIEMADVIQTFCRKCLGKIYRLQREAKDKLAKSLYEMYREKFFKDLSEMAPDIKDAIDGKYAKSRKLRKAFDGADDSRIRALLRKYWERWKRKAKKEPDNEDYIILLQRNIRMLLSKKKLNGLRRLQEILYKLYLLHQDNGKGLLESALRRWRAEARKDECEENAEIIQDFCRKRLNRRLRQKLLRLLMLLSNKYIWKIIKDIARMNKTNKALRHHPLEEGMDALKRRAKYDYLKEILLKIISKYDDNMKRLLLKYYIEKWNKKAQRLKQKEIDAATEMEAVSRGYLYRKHFLKDFLRKKLLKNIVGNNRYIDLLPYALAKWKKNTEEAKCEENAKIIQNFCRKIFDKILKSKIRKNNRGYNSLASILNKITISPEEFFERLKKIYRLSKLKDLVEDLNQNRLDKLKWAFDKIREYPKKKYMSRMLGIKDDFYNRLLKKYFDRWKDKTTRHKAIMIYLESIFRNYEDFDKNLTRYYLSKWVKNTNLVKQNQQAKIIQGFCRTALSKILARRNWLRIAKLLRIKYYGESSAEIIRKLRTYFGLEKLKKPIVRHVRKEVLEDLKNNGKNERFRKRIGPLIDRLNKDNEEYWLRKYLERWREIARKMKEKEEKLGEMMDVLEKVRNKKATPNVEYASIIKNLFKALPYLKALACFRRLRDYAFNKNKNDNLARDLLRAKDDLEPKIEDAFIKKLYKVYAYKVLNKFMRNLLHILNRNARYSKRIFLSRLYDILLKQAECNYRNKKSNEVEPLKSKNSFRLKKPKKDDMDKNKRLTYVTLTPYLVKYLNEKFLERKQETMNTLKRTSRPEKFCELYKKWVEQKEIPPKRDLIDKLRAQYEYLKRRGPLLEKLYKLLRILAIKRMLRHSGRIARLMNLLYLLRLIEMEKNIAKERWLRSLIRRWRYIAFSKKLATNKMKTIYKNLHMTYLEVASTLFGEESKTDPSIIKEFERFGTSVGMWENKKPEYKEEERYIKEMKTEYVFNDIGFEEYLEEKYLEEAKIEAEKEKERAGEEEEIKTSYRGKGAKGKGKREVDDDFRRKYLSKK